MTRMSSWPPSARSASPTALLAPAVVPRSPRTAAVMCGSAAGLRLRYPTATLAPARDSSSAVARPMPRPPPVTNARFPVRSITATPRTTHGARSSFQPVLDEIANDVLDGQMQLLNAGGVGRRNDQRRVGEILDLAAAFAQERDDADAAGLRRLRGPDDVRTLARCRMQHDGVTRLGEGFDLPREHFVESHVVGTGGEEGRIRRERHRAHGGAIALIANDVFRGDMLGIGGAAAVAGEEQRAAAAKGPLVAIGDRHDLLRLLRGDPAGECRQVVQTVADSRGVCPRSGQRAASTNASSPPRPPRFPSSPCGPSSTTVPMTTKSAPAFRAARACAGVRMPPPTNSGRWATATRHARITSTETGRSAPLPASR